MSRTQILTPGQETGHEGGFSRAIEAAEDQLSRAWQHVVARWHRLFADDQEPKEGLRLVLPREHESPLVMPGHSVYPTFSDRPHRRNGDQR